MRGPAVAAVLALFGVLQAQTVHAATFNFTGVVTATDRSDLGFDVGDAVSVSFDYNSTTTVLINGVQALLTATNTPTLTDGMPMYNDDVLLIEALQNSVSFGAVSYAFGDMDLEFRDSSGTVFSGTSLPSSINLASFDSATLVLFYSGATDGGGDLVVRADITGQLPPDSNGVVPEPSTFALFALGAGSLWIYRRRRSRPV